MAVVSSSRAPCRGAAQKKIARNNVRVNLEYSSGFILIGSSFFIFQESKLKFNKIIIN
jgi:hypothetical protein